MDGMFPVPPEIAKQIIEAIKNQICGADTKNWVTVGKLKPEDLTKRATYLAEAKRMSMELEELKAKAKVLNAQQEAASTEWWNHLKRTYSLPLGENYTLTDDGQVLMEPKN